MDESEGPGSRETREPFRSRRAGVHTAMGGEAIVDVIRLHGDDSVAVAARPLPAGARVRLPDGHDDLELTERVEMGHKVALRAIRPGQAVIKYGQTIGLATQPIEPGQWVHEHNLAMAEDAKDCTPSAPPPAPEPITDRTFMGYRRPDGPAATRNYVAVISLVNCSASVTRGIAERFDERSLRDWPNIDGVIALTHATGCGMVDNSAYHDQFNRVLGGFARHPNVAAYVLVGLGYEVAAVDLLIESGALARGPGANGLNPATLSMQDCGGTARTIEQGVRMVSDMLPRANDVKRERIPAAELLLGNECGGSDGNSGVTANPALGAAADMLVAAGGTVMISETSEIYGAEHLLSRRARSPEIAKKLVELIDWWKRYTAMFDAKIDANPNPGNKAGGITTIYEKSLGAVAKGGTTALNGVYAYAERVGGKGLVMMDTPGYDPASITGMVAGGANVICFTTGRGSCYGCKPVPTIKIASNTPMYEHMIDDMDLNAGVILEGTSVGAVGREIFELVLDVAGGRKTKSELHGVGEAEFVPWVLDPVL